MNLKSTVRNILFKNGITSKVEISSYTGYCKSNVNDKIYDRLFNFGLAKASTSVQKLCVKNIEKNTNYKKYKFGPKKFILEIAHNYDSEYKFVSYTITNSEVKCLYFNEYDECFKIKTDSIGTEEEFELMLLYPTIIFDFISTEFVEKVRKLAKKNTKYYINIDC